MNSFIPVQPFLLVVFWVALSRGGFSLSHYNQICRGRAEYAACRREPRSSGLLPAPQRASQPCQGAEQSSSAARGWERSSVEPSRTPPRGILPSRTLPSAQAGTGALSSSPLAKKGKAQPRSQQAWSYPRSPTPIRTPLHLLRVHHSLLSSPNRRSFISSLARDQKQRGLC